MHPAPLVVQVEMIALQILSEVNVTGNKAQVNGIHVEVTTFQAQVNYNDAANGVLLHSVGVLKPPQVDGFCLQ